MDGWKPNPEEIHRPAMKLFLCLERSFQGILAENIRPAGRLDGNDLSPVLGLETPLKPPEKDLASSVEPLGLSHGSHG
jgi:hypothetical protein